MDNYSLADIAAVTDNDRNNNGFGGDWGAWIILFLIFGMFGWGGFGGFGNGYGANGAGLQGMATRADINEGFALNNLERGIQGIQQGICDSTYALNNNIQQGFANSNMGMMQGFNGVERGFSNISSQLSDCCCQTQRAIDSVNYNMAKNTCDLQNAMCTNTRDILDNQNTNTRAILDFLTQSKIDTLRDENQELRRSASQDRQNAYITTAMQAQTAQIIDRIAPYPIPAYQVSAPYPYCNAGYSGGCGCSC